MQQLWNFKRTTYFEMVCITIPTAASILLWQHCIFHCEWTYWEPQWTLCSRVRLYKCTVRSTRKTQFERKLFRLKSFGRVLPVSLHRVCTTLKGFETWHLHRTIFKYVTLVYRHHLYVREVQDRSTVLSFEAFSNTEKWDSKGLVPGTVS